MSRWIFRSKPSIHLETKPQLILLDHGLYYTFSDSFRIPYCQLWKSLALRDTNGVKAAANKMGLFSQLEYIPFLLNMRTPNSTAAWGDGAGDVDRAKLRREAREKGIAAVTAFIEALPPEMVQVSDGEEE